MWVELTSLLHAPMHTPLQVPHPGGVSGWVAQNGGGNGGGGMPGDTGPAAPPGVGTKFTTLLGYAKWVALAAIIITFFAGVSQFTAGRIGRHGQHGASGMTLMVVSGVGAVLYAVGYGVITGLAQ